MSLWVDKHRPNQLIKLDYHKEQAIYLKKLVRMAYKSLNDNGCICLKQSFWSLWSNSPIHKAAGSLVTGRSLQNGKMSMGNCRTERPPDPVLYGGRPSGGFVNSAVNVFNRQNDIGTRLKKIVTYLNFQSQLESPSTNGTIPACFTLG